MLSADPDVVSRADFLVLPGVGAFDAGMGRLNETGLRDALDHAVLNRGVKLAGICLGMQFLVEGSEEGVLPGLGYIKGNARKFPAGMDNGFGRPLKVPHMGWNEVKPIGGSKLFASFGLEEALPFYFVHSYFVEVSDPSEAVASTGYGLEFTSAIQKQNVFGFQFHPEKSNLLGMRLLSEVLRHG